MHIFRVSASFLSLLFWGICGSEGLIAENIFECFGWKIDTFRMRGEFVSNRSDFLCFLNLVILLIPGWSNM